MPYCPECRAEYQAGIEKCTDCGVALVEQLPDAEQELLEVFRCADEATAERICSVVLHEVSTLIRSRTSTAFPTPGVTLGQHYIAVGVADWERSRTLLQEAIDDGAITEEDGELIDE